MAEGTCVHMDHPTSTPAQRASLTSGHYGLKGLSHFGPFLVKRGEVQGDESIFSTNQEAGKVGWSEKRDDLQSLAWWHAPKAAGLPHSTTIWRVFTQTWAGCHFSEQTLGSCPLVPAGCSWCWEQPLSCAWHHPVLSVLLLCQPGKEKPSFSVFN